MTDYEVVDKNSSIVIICSAKNELEAIKDIKERIKFIDFEFRIQEVEE